jgi:hypothetical protein
MAALSWFYLAALPFLSLAVSWLIIANRPSHCLNFSHSPGIEIRAEFFFRLGAGPLNFAA